MEKKVTLYRETKFILYRRSSRTHDDKIIRTTDSKYERSFSHALHLSFTPESPKEHQSDEID